MVLRHLRPLDGAAVLGVTEPEAIAALAGWVASRMGPPEEVDEEHHGRTWVVGHELTTAYERGCEMLGRCGVGVEGPGGEIRLREPGDLDRAAETTSARPLETLPRLDDAIQVALTVAGREWGVHGINRPGPSEIPAGFPRASRERIRVERERVLARSAERARRRGEHLKAEAERRDEAERRAEAEGRRYFRPMESSSLHDIRANPPEGWVPAGLDVVLRGLGMRDDAGWTAEAEVHLWRNELADYGDWFTTDPRFQDAVERCIATVPGDLRPRWRTLARDWTSAGERPWRIEYEVECDLVAGWRLEGWLDEAGRRRALNIFGDRVTRAAAPILMERVAA